MVQLNIKIMKTFYWNKETLEYYSTHLNEIENFVKYECDLEDNETYEDLIKDLTKQSKNYDKEKFNNWNGKYFNDGNESNPV
jgi:hypothetical protein